MSEDAPKPKLFETSEEVRIKWYEETEEDWQDAFDRLDFAERRRSDIRAQKRMAEALLWIRIHDAEVMLKTLKERETSGERIAPNDSTYPLSEAKKLAVEALMVSFVAERSVPFEVLELVAHLFGLPLDGSKTDKRRSGLYYLAAYYDVDHPQASLREVAQVLGADKNTIKKWRGEEEYRELVRLIKHVQDNYGASWSQDMFGDPDFMRDLLGSRGKWSPKDGGE